MKNLLTKIPENIKEALKEAGRLALLAAASYLISFGLNYTTGLPETQTTMILTLALKGLDKWLHETGKDQKSNLQGGLTRF